MGTRLEADSNKKIWKNFGNRIETEIEWTVSLSYLKVFWAEIARLRQAATHARWVVTITTERGQPNTVHGIYQQNIFNI